MQKGIDGLIKSVRFIPDDYRLHYLLADSYLSIVFNTENKGYVYLEARKAYSKVLELYPNYYEAYQKIGVVFLVQGFT